MFHVFPIVHSPMFIFQNLSICKRVHLLSASGTHWGLVAQQQGQEQQEAESEPSLLQCAERQVVQLSNTCFWNVLESVSWSIH